MHFEARRGGPVGREQLAQALLERISRAGDGPEIDALLEGAKGLERCGTDRPAFVPRPVPAPEMARGEDIEDCSEHDGADDTGELERLRAARGHAHLHASTARVATNSGKRIIEP